MSLIDINNPILYSTMSFLAYNINIKYYHGLHYLWCTPYFRGDVDSPHHKVPSTLYTVPPSSSPFDIYRTLQNEVNGGDGHGYKIRLNRMGIRKGARAMLARGSISEGDMKEINYCANVADLTYFRPLLCVISKLEAIPYYRRVDIKEKASPLSYEYILADLPQSVFDVISMG